MPAFDVLPLAVALLIGIPAFGSCLGIGRGVLEGMACQPELALDLQTKHCLAVGVTDGAFIIATGIGLRFATATPFGHDGRFSHRSKGRRPAASCGPGRSGC